MDRTLRKSSYQKRGGGEGEYGGEPRQVGSAGNGGGGAAVGKQTTLWGSCADFQGRRIFSVFSHSGHLTLRRPTGRALRPNFVEICDNGALFHALSRGKFAPTALN